MKINNFKLMIELHCLISDSVKLCMKPSGLDSKSFNDDIKLGVSAVTLRQSSLTVSYVKPSPRDILALAPAGLY